MMYKGQHSLSFASIDESGYGVQNTYYNTWKDFHLIPTSRPVFKLPELKSEYVDVPQRDGSIDLTTKLGHANLPRYGMRRGTWEFWVPSFLSEWPMDYQKLANAVHGLTKHVICDDDPYFYYTGRITVDDWQNGTDGNGNKVTLGYTLEPFKEAMLLWGSQKQEWDPICFPTDYFYSDGSSAPTKDVRINAGEYVDFLFPSAVVHTDSHANKTPSSYPYINPTPDRLFSGMVQTSFKLRFKSIGGTTINTTMPVEVYFKNDDVIPGERSYTFYPFLDPYTSNWTVTHDDFILSHRDLRNQIRITVHSDQAVLVSLEARVRSL